MSALKIIFHLNEAVLVCVYIYIYLHVWGEKERKGFRLEGIEVKIWAQAHRQENIQCVHGMLAYNRVPREDKHIGMRVGEPLYMGLTQWFLVGGGFNLQEHCQMWVVLGCHSNLGALTGIWSVRAWSIRQSAIYRTDLFSKGVSYIFKCENFHQTFTR